ncbi:MAG: SRPBCC family protein [Actinomycetota bacterium]|nr:SRPBCC family protein [Actinomycetota bacterium]
MSVNHVRIDAAPDDVFRILRAAERYADWIYGAKVVRDVDQGWPGVNAAFHHTVSMGLLRCKDSTKILEIDAPHRLVLEARMRPFGVAHVIVTVTPVGAGVRVTMEEKVVSGHFFRPKRWLEPLLALRNAISLRRLKVLVEGEL